MEILHAEKMLDDAMVSTIHTFLKSNTIAPTEVVKVEKCTFAERSKTCQNQVGSRLYEIMLQKKTNLAVAADLKRYHPTFLLISSFPSFLLISVYFICVYSSLSIDFLINKLF